MASWPSTAEVALPRRAPAGQPDKRAARPRARSSAGMAGGVVWIVLVALLLTGVVAMNVTVLRLNVELDRLGGERANLRAENALLESRLSSTAGRNEAFARTRLGLVLVEPEYVTLGDGR